MGAPAKDPRLPPQNRPALETPLPSPVEATSEKSHPAAQEFSLVLGGPVYDFLLRIGLLRFALPNVLRRIVVIVAITWLPLLVLSLKDGLAFGERVRIPLLYDFSMYARFLLGLPLLIVAEIVIDPAIRRAVQEFVNMGFIRDDGLQEFDDTLLKVQRLRDSVIPEVILLVLAFFPVFVFQHEWTAGTVSSWHTTARGLTMPGWWFATVSAPFLRFIMYRWAYRYFIWSVLLWRVGRLNLYLMPTHPDRAAGLDFLSLAQRRFGILFCAMGCAFAGRVANSMVFEGAPLASFKFLMIGFVALSLILGLLPLTLLAPKLARVRTAGLFAYGKLSNQYTRSFDQKWVHRDEPLSEPLLGTADIQSLADLGNSYSIVSEMTIAPITKKLVIQLAVQAAVPLVPVVVLGTPTTELVNSVLKMVV